MIAQQLNGEAAGLRSSAHPLLKGGFHLPATLLADHEHLNPITVEGIDGQGKACRETGGLDYHGEAHSETRCWVSCGFGQF
jgi:hypothetical protein